MAAAAKDWLLGLVRLFRATTVIGGNEAKTTRETVVYKDGCAIMVTKAPEATM